MSIPLVQNNEKDSINTSIIAIKRNIERINMLLGLSNSEEIDTSKFATKEELQQAVTDLQPVNEVAVDNMHSVTSNAVANELKRELISSGTTSLGGNYYLYKCGHIRELYLEGFSVPNGYDGNFLNIGLDDAPRSRIYAMCDGGSGSMYITSYFSVRLDSYGNVYTYGYSAYPSAYGHFIWTV